MASSLVATQWTTPTTAAQRPFILWCDWQDVIGYVPLESIRITDAGGNVPATMTFKATDRTNTVGGMLAKQMRVLLVDTVEDRILFQGFVKYLRPKVTATYTRWEVVCSDLSEVLDWGRPIEVFPRPAEGDRARIQAILGNFGIWGNMNGQSTIASLNTGLTATDLGHSSVRAAIEDTLRQTGDSPVGYYVDKLGGLNTYTSAPGGSAPYNISDAPDFATTIPAALEIEDDGSSDCDAVWVNGGSAAGTGLVLSASAPRYPWRVAVIDAPDSLDAATLQAIGLAELGNRQNNVKVTATIAPDDTNTFAGKNGWDKGQSITVTSAPLGWSAKSFVIQGVDVAFVNGKGQRRYRLTLGTRPTQRMHVVHHIAAKVAPVKHKRQQAHKVSGRLASAKKA